MSLLRHCGRGYGGFYKGKSKANIPGPVKIKETAMANFMNLSVQERGCRPFFIIELIIISETAIVAA